MKVVSEVVSIVGVGLIGGSFALALRKAGFDGKIIGVSSPDTVRIALERGVIDEALPLDLAAEQSDLIYLAQPICRILETLDVIDGYVRPGTPITDAGSTKTAIVARAAARIQRGFFLGGHPMAGKESRGVAEADADLFRGRAYVLTTPDVLTRPDADQSNAKVQVAELKEWIGRIGARLVILSAAEHDRLVALTSHLPQLIATALASSIGSEPGSERVAGPGAADMTRLALSSYDIWRDIFATNSEPVDAALGKFIGKLEELRGMLRDPQIGLEFERAAAAARNLREPK